MHVADEVDAVGHALGREVGDGGRRRREQPAREVVGHDAVDLLGHPPVEAAQAGLDVRDGDAELRRGERPGERRVRVAVDEHRVRPLGDEDRLERRRASAPSARPGRRRRRRGSGPASAGRARAKNAPAIASSQCWPVSTKTSSWRARSAGCSAAALISWGRVPTTLTIRTAELVPSGATGRPAPVRGRVRPSRRRPVRPGTPMPRYATPSGSASSRRLSRPSNSTARSGNQAGSSVANSGSRGLGDDRPERRGVAPGPRRGAARGRSRRRSSSGS